LKAYSIQSGWADNPAIAGGSSFTISGNPTFAPLPQPEPGFNWGLLLLQVGAAVALIAALQYRKKARQWERKWVELARGKIRGAYWRS
jgi:hypothetical protein